MHYGYLSQSVNGNLVVRYANLFSYNFSCPFSLALICIFNTEPEAASHLVGAGAAAMMKVFTM